MIEIMFIEIIAKALVLCLILYLVARHEADYSFHKVAMVTAAIGLGTLLIDVLCRPHIGWFALLPVVAFVMFMLMKFCWISFLKAALVTVIFIAFCVVFSIGVTVVLTPVNKSIETGMSRRPTDEKDFQQVLKLMKRDIPTKPVPKSSEHGPLDTSLAETMGKWLSNLKGYIAGSDENGASDKADMWKESTTPDTKIVQERTSGKDVTAEVEIRQDSVPADLCDWAGAEAKLKVSGIITGGQGRHIAVINNQTVQDGDIVTLEHEKNIYTWKIGAITRDNIEWRQLHVLKAD